MGSDASSVDAVQLAGWTLPGTCAVSATHSRVDLVERLTSKEQLKELWPILDVLRNSVGRTVAISHPMLDVMGIRSVEVLRVGIPRPAAVGIGLVVEYELRPAKTPEEPT